MLLKILLKVPTLISTELLLFNKSVISALLTPTFKVAVGISTCSITVPFLTRARLAVSLDFFVKPIKAFLSIASLTVANPKPTP